MLRRRLSFVGRAQVGAHLLRFMLFHGTGVRFLLSNAYFRKCVENRFAFDFQLPGQIVNSNLAHPPFLSSGLSAKSSYQPHGVGFVSHASTPRGQRITISLFFAFGGSRLLRWFFG
jgi:hypothetical protein